MSTFYLMATYLYRIEFMQSTGLFSFPPNYFTPSTCLSSSPISPLALDCLLRLQYLVSSLFAAAIAFRQTCFHSTASHLNYSPLSSYLPLAACAAIPFNLLSFTSLLFLFIIIFLTNPSNYVESPNFLSFHFLSLHHLQTHTHIYAAAAASFHFHFTFFWPINLISSHLISLQIISST